MRPPSLFDLAHPGDPDTSVEAAESVRPHIGAQMLDVLEILAGGPATAHEITHELHRTTIGAWQQSVVARRLTDLRERGLAVDTGERREGATGRRLIVWAVTPDGRDLIRYE